MKNKVFIGTAGTPLEEWARLAPRPGESITVYAMSNLARRLIPVYLSMGIKVDCIIDRDPALSRTVYNGIPIIQPDEFSGEGRTIVLCLGQVFMPVFRRLRNRGFKRVVPYYFYLFDKEINLDASTIEDVHAAYYDKWALSRPKDYALDSLDVPVTMKCSLRCKDCANLMQYFSKPAHSDFELMTRSLEKIFTVVDHVFEVRVLGGEPFMYGDLHRYIEFIKQYSAKYDMLLTLTNGTIIPNQRNLDALKGQKITLQISDYNSPRQKLPELLRVCEQNGIITKVLKDFRWQNSSRIRQYGRTDAENAELLRRCAVRGCATITDGKLFYCPIAGNMYTLRAVPKEHHVFVPLLDTSIPDGAIRERINTLMHTKQLKTCDFCGGRPPYGNDIPPAIQADKPLEYTKYEF
jgi:organic radical activating enzyme